MKQDRLVQLLLIIMAGGFAWIATYMRTIMLGLIEDMAELVEQVEKILKYLELTEERADDGK